MSIIERAPRRIPGEVVPCRRCGAGIVWAATAARDTGRGGKAMPLDWMEHLEGNIAVEVRHRGHIVARVLKKDEQVDRPLHFQAMPHFATCGARQ